jgi:hypothetical protein
MKRSAGLVALLGLSLLLSACSGLGGEPPIVATLAINTPRPTLDATALAQIHAQVTPATPVGTPLSAAPEEALGTVSGQVINATANAALPADLEIELHSVDRSFNDSVLKTKADADGKFRFENVPIRADRSYFTAAVIDGRYFASEPLIGDPTSPTLELPFKIYERTADPSVLKVANVVTQVSPDENSLYVVQIIRFENTSDRLFSTDERIGDERFASVRVTLPQSAVLLGFATDEARYHVQDGVITDTQPVYPETRHIVHFRYLLPYQPSGTQIALPLPYRIDGTITLLVNPANLSVSAQIGDQALPAQGSQMMSDVPYLTYSGAFQLPPETTLTYTLSGALSAPSAAEATANGGAMQPIALALIVGGALLIGVGVILLVRGARQQTPAASQERLIAALAALDEQYKQGELTQSAYARRRDALKAQLARLMRGK